MIREEAIEDWYDVPSNEMILERARQASKDLRKRFREDLEQEPCKVSEYDKDHIWYKGVQYISLRRFLEVKSEIESWKSGDKE